MSIERPTDGAIRGLVFGLLPAVVMWAVVVLVIAAVL